MAAVNITNVTVTLPTATGTGTGVATATLAVDTDADGLAARADLQWSDHFVSATAAWLLVVVFGAVAGIVQAARAERSALTARHALAAAARPAATASLVFLLMSISNNALPYDSVDGADYHLYLRVTALVGTVALSGILGYGMSVLALGALERCPVRVATDVGEEPAPAILAEHGLAHILHEAPQHLRFASQFLTDPLAARDVAKRAAKNAHTFRPQFSSIPDPHLKEVVRELKDAQVSEMVTLWLRLYIVVRRWVKAGDNDESSGFDNRIRAVLAKSLNVLERGPESRDTTHMPDGVAEALWSGLQYAVSTPELHGVAYELLRALTVMALPDLHGAVVDAERSGCAVVNLTYSVLLTCIAGGQAVQLPAYATDVPSGEAEALFNDAGDTVVTPRERRRVDRAVAMEILITGAGAPELGSTLAARVAAPQAGGYDHPWHAAQQAFADSAAVRLSGGHTRAASPPGSPNTRFLHRQQSGVPGQGGSVYYSRALLARLESLCQYRINSRAHAPALERSVDEDLVNWADEYTTSPLTRKGDLLMLDDTAALEKTAMLLPTYTGSRFVREGEYGGCIIHYRGYKKVQASVVSTISSVWAGRGGNAKAAGGDGAPTSAALNMFEEGKTCVGKRGWGVSHVLPTGWVVQHGVVKAPAAMRGGGARAAPDAEAGLNPLRRLSSMFFDDDEGGDDGDDAPSDAGGRPPGTISRGGVRDGMVAREILGESADPKFRRWSLFHSPPVLHVPPRAFPAYPALLRALGHQTHTQFARRDPLVGRGGGSEERDAMGGSVVGGANAKTMPFTRTGGGGGGGGVTTHNDNNDTSARRSDAAGSTRSVTSLGDRGKKRPPSAEEAERARGAAATPPSKCSHPQLGPPAPGDTVLTLHVVPSHHQMFRGVKLHETGSVVNPFHTPARAFRCLEHAKVAEEVEAIVVRCLPGVYDAVIPDVQCVGGHAAVEAAKMTSQFWAERHAKAPGAKGGGVGADRNRLRARGPDAVRGFCIPDLTLSVPLIVCFEHGSVVSGVVVCNASRVILTGPVTTGALCIAPHATDVVVNNYFNISPIAATSDKAAAHASKVLCATPALDANRIHLQRVHYRGAQTTMDGSEVLEEAPSFPRALPYTARARHITQVVKKALPTGLPVMFHATPYAILKSPPPAGLVASPVIWRALLVYIPFLSLLVGLITAARLTAGLGNLHNQCFLDFLPPPCTNVFVFAAALVTSAVVLLWFVPRAVQRRSQFIINMFNEDRPRGEGMGPGRRSFAIVSTAKVAT